MTGLIGLQIIQPRELMLNSEADTFGRTGPFPPISVSYRAVCFSPFNSIWCHQCTTRKKMLRISDRLTLVGHQHTDQGSDLQSEDRAAHQRHYLIVLGGVDKRLLWKELKASAWRAQVADNRPLWSASSGAHSRLAEATPKLWNSLILIIQMSQLKPIERAVW